MKKNYRVVRNESDPVIPTRPDFSGLLEKVQADGGKSWWQKPQYYLPGGLALVAGIALLIFTNKQPKIEPNDKINNKISSITPPVPIWDVAYDTFNVNVANGDTLIYKGCTKIIVPAGGITGVDGGKISTTQLVYREIRNQAEIMASGIPMMYDSAGKKLLFESGGMFEMRTVNSDEQISSTGIKVQMCSSTIDAGYNWYNLDEKTGKWSYLEPVKYVNQNKMDSGAHEYIDAELIGDTAAWREWKPAQIAPQHPPVRTPGRHTFRVIEPDVPELAIYKDLVFEVLPGQGYAPDKLPDNWDGISIQRTNAAGIFRLILSNPGQQYSFKAIPVFETAESRRQALAILDEKNTIDLDRIEPKQPTARKPATSYVVNRKFSYAAMTTAFSLNKFGYYNSDRPIPAGNSMNISYSIGKDLQPNSSFLYLFYLNRNACMVNYGIGNTTIHYSETDYCALIYIDEMNKTIAILSPEEFHEQIQKQRKNRIILNPVERTFNSANEIQKFIMDSYGRKR